jgi:hypothetical protein
MPVSACCLLAPAHVRAANGSGVDHVHEISGVGDDIAHDLRTPLTRVRIRLERGRQHAATLEDLRKVTDQAIAGLDQSLAIITALLRGAVLCPAVVIGRPALTKTEFTPPSVSSTLRSTSIEGLHTHLRSGSEPGADLDALDTPGPGSARSAASASME